VSGKGRVCPRWSNETMEKYRQEVPEEVQEEENSGGRIGGE